MVDQSPGIRNVFRDDHLDCVFDRWAYYYSIEAVEGVPVDFNEVRLDIASRDSVRDRYLKAD